MYSENPDRSASASQEKVGCRCCCATCLCLTLGLLQTLAVHRNAAVAVQLLPLWRRRLVGVCSAAVGSLFILLTTVPSESEGERELRNKKWVGGMEDHFTVIFHSDSLVSKQTNRLLPCPSFVFVFCVSFPLIKPNCHFEFVLESNSKTNPISITHKQKQRSEGSCSKLLLKTTD